MDSRQTYLLKILRTAQAFYAKDNFQADSLGHIQVGEGRRRAEDQGGRQEGENRSSNLEEVADGPAYNSAGPGRVWRRR